jgi:aminoglycoside 2'-N-acetyltransferase I
VLERLEGRSVRSLAIAVLLDGAVVRLEPRLLGLLGGTFECPGERLIGRHLVGPPCYWRVPTSIDTKPQVQAWDANPAATIHSVRVGTRPDIDPDRPQPRRVSTPDLTATEVAAIREMLAAAFGSDEEERFTDDDWGHALGGVHFVLGIDGEIVAHASVVERELRIDGRPLRTGYVEAVATAPDHQGAGLGSLVMEDVVSFITERFELGALGTGRHSFYERLGWQTWRGPSSVRTPDGSRRTPDDDGYIMVLPTPSSPSFDLAGPISCEWRPGDVW